MNYNSNRLFKKAFTLIELLVVIAILGVLFIVLISRVDFATDKAKTTGVQTDFRSFQLAFKQVGVEQQEFVDDLDLLISQVNINLDTALQFSKDQDTMLSSGRDPWGTQYIATYQLIHNTRGSIEVRSAGKDQKMYTTDDYITVITYALMHDGGRIVITSDFDGLEPEEKNAYEVIKGLEPGLYADDGTYSSVKYTWQELLDNDYIVVINNVAGVPYNDVNGSNALANILDGILILPNYITGLAENAFKQCNKITQIRIPGSISSIGEGAFDGCVGMRAVYYEGALDDWCRVELSTFDSTPCYNDVVMYLNGIRFGGDIVLPNDLTKINNYTFFGAQYVTSIKIPNGLTYSGLNNFWGCSNLRNVYYEGTLEQWLDIDFAYNGNPLLYSANFYCNSSLITRVDIPSTDNRIKQYMFDGCISIAEVYIPISITSIETDVFCSCINLKLIVYEGTKAQWNAITKGMYWNAYLTDYTIRCSDGELIFN